MDDKSSWETLHRALFWDFDHFVVVTNEDGVIVDMNPAAERVFGYTRDDLVGRAKPDIFADPEELRALAREKGRPADPAEGLAAFLAEVAAARTLRREWTLYRKDGSRFSVMVTASALHEPDGRISGFVGTGWDLSAQKDLERRSAAAAQRLEEALEAFSEGFMLIAPDGRISLLSSRMKELYPMVAHVMVPGARFEDVLREGARLGQYDLQGMAPEDWIAQRLRKQENPSAPFEQHLADGRWLLIREHRTSDGSIASIRTDITSLKQSQAALKEALEFKAAILDAAPLAIIAVDTSGSVTLWAGAAEEIFGWKAEDVIGKPNPIVPPSEWESFRRFLGQELEGERHVHEVVRRRKDGRPIEISLNAAPVRDGNGKIIGALAVIADISAKKRAEEALRESEERLRIALSGADLGTWDYDLLAGQVHWDERSRSMFGIEDGATIAYEAVLNLVHPEDRPGLEQAVARALDPAGTGHFQAEYRVLRQDGGVHWVLARGRAFFTDGSLREAKRFIGTVMDITDRKKAEERRIEAERALERAQRMEALGQLAGGLAHELNNALVPMIGLTELAVAKLPPEDENRQRLQMVLSAANHAADTVKRVLTFSRHTPEMQGPHSLREAVKDAIGLVRMAVPSSVTIGEDLPDEDIRSECDPGEIQQILLNLASNAADAIAPETGRLRIELSLADTPFLPPELPPGRYARLVVADTGRGLSETAREKIFEPFFTTKPVGEGTGLGLAVVHGIVTAHGGAIRVDSEIGGGTSVTIYLPVLEEGALAVE